MQKQDTNNTTNGELILTVPPSSTNSMGENLDFINMLSSYKNFLVFSPHLDDAALSMGSVLTYLCTKKQTIKIVNLFTEGSPLLSSLNEKLLRQATMTTAADYFLARRNEDIEAVKKIGNIPITNLGFTDGAWRIGNNNELLYPDKVLTDIKEEDSATIAVIEKRIQEITVDSTTAIFAPLARGRHVDHQITRNIITKLFPKVIYYSDFPYSNKYTNEDTFISTHGLQSIEWHGDYTKKKEAILTYVTQRTSFIETNPMPIGFERFYFKTQV